jgi:hypothetical protein
LLDDLRLFGRYATGLVAFLRRPLTYEEARARLQTQLRERERSFLDVLDRAVFRHPRSPYLPLLRHAGLEYGDVQRLVRDRGVDGAVGALFDAGIYVTLDEVKGRTPVRRAGLEFETHARDFDNPLVGPSLAVETGGSGGEPRPVYLGFRHLEYEAAQSAVFRAALGVEGRPTAVWYPLPPSVAGIGNLLRDLKHGVPIERWFTQSPVSVRRGAARATILGATAAAAGRVSPLSVPFPRHTPPEDAVRVARWLAARRPAVLLSTPSSGVRVCLAAAKHGLDLRGTLFRFSGEPYTETKARTVRDAGARGVSVYSLAETGPVGVPCADPIQPDDVHVATEKLVVLQRQRQVPSGEQVGVLFFTTLLSSAPKIFLNVDSGDYAVVEKRACDCSVGALELTTHAHTIRSVEKLTTEGMSFLGDQLIRLVEEVLPARFGGGPTDYQLAEQEGDDGVSRVWLLASPRLGPLDEDAVVPAALDFLRSCGRGEAMMADFWRTARTLQLRRQEPYVTGASKVLPVHPLGRYDDSSGN